MWFAPRTPPIAGTPQLVIASVAKRPLSDRSPCPMPEVHWRGRGPKTLKKDLPDVVLEDSAGSMRQWDMQCDWISCLFILATFTRSSEIFCSAVSQVFLQSHL
jgi:hypothetical protein